MDPKRDFRLPGAAALASDVGGSGSEWEYEGSDEDDDLELSPTTGRVLTPPERLIKHGTVERGAAYCLPCLAEAEVFNITDDDGGQPTGMLYKHCDPGDFYMKVIAKKFRGVWHYGVITGVVTEWVLEDYGGATQWRAVFEDGGIVGLLRSEVRSGKVTVQPGWVMEDCLHHMETFSILNAGPLLEEARVKAIMPEKELASPAVVRSVSRLAVLGHMYKRMQGAAWFVTRWGLQNVVTEEDGPERKAQRGAKARRPGQRGAKARRPGQRGANARRPGQRGAKARRPGQRGAKARRPGQRGANARRPGQRGAKARRPGQRGANARRPGQRGANARRPGQRGAKARRPGQRGAKARRPGQRGANARRPGQRGAKTAHTAESAERDALQVVDGSR
eukprot:jgi/Tetstr1/435034/TSEL_024004.t1